MKHVKCYIPSYPRPQLVRDNWTNLNGEWLFGFGEDVSAVNALIGALPLKINVPFSYETELSGIHDDNMHKRVWYSRRISRKKGCKTLLHFDGADYITTVYINGKKVGSHIGAYSRFSFDITKFLTKPENILTVCCDDENHPSQVRGKQRWENQNFGCWYVQTTGIYKTVWLEYVNEVYLSSLKITPCFSDFSVRFDASVSKCSDDIEICYDISFNGMHIQSACVCACDIENGVTVNLSSAKMRYQVEHWSPDNPALYDVDITVYKKGRVVDKVGSYFGLRDYRASNGKLLLNNMPFYAKLVLDQGYWRESGITPPTEEALVRDIQLCKQMGFNGARKHQKVEDERYFYYADIIGFTVWCELPSNHWANDQSSVEITQEWLQIVRQNYNHPSLVTWVVFNESWGVRNIYVNEHQQNLANALYYLTKSIDTMRPVISNDGWVHTKSDILTLHHYEQDGEKLYAHYDNFKKIIEGDGANCQNLPYALGYKYENQPIIFSEFGGTAYVRDSRNGNWGYGMGVKDSEEYISRLTSLVAAIKKMGVNGYCYTQITDVEQEVNGLLLPDRTPKVDLKEILKINS